MKRVKKLLALFLSVVMVLGMIPGVVFAADETGGTETGTGTEAMVTEKPEITWQRTKELVYSEAGMAGLYAGAKTDYESVDSSTSNNIKYTWTFETIANALNGNDDETSNVWDYGKKGADGNSIQYASPTENDAKDDTYIIPQDGVFAATWNNRSYKEQTVTYDDNGTKKTADYDLGGFDTGHAGSYTVRKFSGTFTWPDGYDLTSNIELVSKNDDNYGEIYDAVAADEDLTAAFGGKKVIAVNDDIYVFIYKEGTTLDKDNYKDYLAFWTGTAGKGVWSWENSQPQDYNWGDVWNQTTPATFNDEYALRAFHSIKPNLDNVKATSTETAKANRGVLANTKMNQSGGWYAFADGNAISTVLNNKYGNETLAGEIFHIDIYCFDTDKVGGMDELELKLTKAAPTEANVTVRYWLNSVGNDITADNFLGESTMTNQKIGETITLANGTAVNQLNYKKAAAIAKNGNRDVADGEQMNTPVVKANSDENIINVVYLPAGDKVVHLYAGTATAQYDGKEHTVKDVTIKETGYDDIVVNDSVATTSYELNDQQWNKNVVENITAQKTETLPGSYDVTFTSKSFVRDAWNRTLNNYTVIQHPGKLTITYDPQPATCTYDFGVKNSYDILNDVEKQAQKITASKDYVTIESGVVFYTPQTVNTGEMITLTLTYEGGYTCEKQITFLPASNVLYEENFMNVEPNGVWESEGTNAAATIVDDNESSVYGYTSAYENFNEYSNGGALKATLNLNGKNAVYTNDAVKFTFTGRGFDLISECGTDTGIIFATVSDKTGTLVKAYIVDTYFCGDEGDSPIITGNGTLDYQVPVIRSMDLDYGTYTVEVYGYVSNGSGASTAKKSSLFGTQSLAAGNDTDSIVRNILTDLGMDDYLDCDVDVSFIDDNSILNGGTGAVKVVEKEQKSIFDRLRDFFTGKTSVFAEESTSETVSDNVYVYLDAFRVYKPLEDDETDYVTNECGLRYGSFYDYIVGSAQDIADNLDGAMVYMEYDGDSNIAVIQEYKKQGPQNEIYLSAGNYVGFVLNGYTGSETAVMVGAKAIYGEAQLNAMKDFVSESISSNLSATEMYYDVTSFIFEDEDLGCVLILGNAGTGVLALSGIKLASNLTPGASDDLAGLAHYNKGDNTFDPKTFDVNYTESVRVGKKTALNVKTSFDVDHIVVYSGSDLTIPVTENVSPNNKKAVANGKAKLYSFNVTVKIENEGKNNTFYVVAYGESGTPSAPIEVTITGVGN